MCQITAGAVERAAVRAEDDDVVAAARRREGARVWRGHPAHRGLRRAPHGVGAAASGSPRRGLRCAPHGVNATASGSRCWGASLRVRWGARQAAQGGFVGGPLLRCRPCAVGSGAGGVVGGRRGARGPAQGGSVGGEASGAGRFRREARRRVSEEGRGRNLLRPLGFELWLEIGCVGRSAGWRSERALKPRILITPTVGSR